jgi:hypothetical protein
LHGSIADLPFPRRIRDELVAAGRARPHHVLPNSGWVTAPMRTDSEVATVIELFRHNYERATQSAPSPASKSKQMINNKRLILVTIATRNVGRQLVS